MKLTAKDKVDIVREYTEQLTPMIELAKRYKMTRQGIHKMLRLYGINTAKQGGIAVSCYTCNKEIKRYKHHVRKRKHLFCCIECYYAYLQAGASHLTPTEQRRGGRRSRIIVNKYFQLEPGHIVHHEDRCSLNTELWNLRVFRNQGDHIRYHRGFDVEPIWSGADLSQRHSQAFPALQA